MLKRVTFCSVGLFVVFVLNSFVNLSNTLAESNAQQENHPPVVKIIAPKNNSFYDWNTPLQYKIKVSDAEDGESAFQEIPTTEVFLEVKYLADASKAAAELDKMAKSAPTGLDAMRRSNCLNCHAFSDKLIGPSFTDISKRYASSKTNIDLLIKRVREGSTGVWGNVTMPTHSEISKEETQEIVEWILKNGAAKGINYYRGTEGYFTIKPPDAAKNGVLVVKAIYTDHGSKDNAKQKLQGQDVVILQCK